MNSKMILIYFMIKNQKKKLKIFLKLDQEDLKIILKKNKSICFIEVILTSQIMDLVKNNITVK